MTNSEKSTALRSSRRRFLAATAATGAFLGVGGMAYAQQGSSTTKYVLEGSAAAWVGVEPEDIAGEENPTLDMRVGQDYEVEFTFTDALPHNFALKDDAGNVLMRSFQVKAGQGETFKFEFTASEEMATYFCEAHPTSMVGDVNTKGSSDGGTETGTATSTETAEGTETETSEGTETETPTGDSGATSFHATLSGDKQVPPLDTEASGEAMANVTDGSLEYTLMLSNTENVTQAHIHQGGADENGPVVAFLFESAQPVDCKGGTITQGTLTSDDLIGPLEGKDLSALVKEMRAGNTYVNVHTEQNPAGEVRGQFESQSS